MRYNVIHKMEDEIHVYGYLLTRSCIDTYVRLTITHPNDEIYIETFKDHILKDISNI